MAALAPLAAPEYDSHGMCLAATGRRQWTGRRRGGIGGHAEAPATAPTPTVDQGSAETAARPGGHVVDRAPRRRATMTSRPAATDQSGVERAGRRTRRQGTARSDAAAPDSVYGVRTAAQVMNRCPPVADQNTSVWGAWGRLRGPDSQYIVVNDRRLR